MALAVSDIDIANSVTTSVTTSSTTRTVNLPTTGADAGKLAVICMAISSSGTAGDALTTPTDWRRVAHGATATAVSTPYTYIFTRIIPGGGLGSSVAITSSVSAICHVAIAFTVANAAEIEDVVSTISTGTSTTLSCPGVTASSTGGLIIRFGTADGNSQSSQPSMTAHTSINWAEATTPGNGCGCFVYGAVQPSTTVAAGTITITSDEWGGWTFVIAESTNPTITDVATDEDFTDGDTGLVITGTNFESTQGTGTVEIGSTSDYGTADLQAQTVTSWGSTSITFTAVLGATVLPGPRYLFVTNDTGDRSSGFAVTIHRKTIFQLAASSNITASGENTTARLTAPSGKTTGDFGGGRIQDDENPGDAVDVAADEYREDEWCIEATSDAGVGEVYVFRIVDSAGTTLDSYSVSPQWTIASSGGGGGPVLLVSEMFSGGFQPLSGGF